MMQNITVLDQSFFFCSTKNQSCKKKSFGDTNFRVAKKKIGTILVPPIPKKTFFFGVCQKKIDYPKKVTAPEFVMFANTFLRLQFQRQQLLMPAFANPPQGIPSSHFSLGSHFLWRD